MRSQLRLRKRMAASLAYNALSPQQITQIDPLHRGETFPPCNISTPGRHPTATLVDTALTISALTSAARFPKPRRLFAKLDYNITADAKHRLSVMAAMINSNIANAPFLPGRRLRRLTSTTTGSSWRLQRRPDDDINHTSVTDRSAKASARLEIRIRIGFIFAGSTTRRVPLRAQAASSDRPTISSTMFRGYMGGILGSLGRTSHHADTEHQLRCVL